MTPRTRTALLSVPLICLILGFALGRHLAVWYSPRWRPAVLDPQTAVGQLLANPDYPVVLWFPYPHQNLDQLLDELGLAKDTHAAMEDLLGLAGATFPSFGSRPLPPSHELAFGFDFAHQSTAVAARVYQVPAWFARLGGQLAGNPWLAGGLVELGDHSALVAWQRSLWSVTVPPVAIDLAPAPRPNHPSETQPWLAALAMHRAWSIVPAGQYHLVFADGEHLESGLVLASDRPLPDLPWPSPATLAQHGLACLVVTGGDALTARPAQALGLFVQPDGNLHEIPHAVVVYAPSSKHWPLPAQDLLALSGRHPNQVERAGWQLASFDQISLQSATALLPQLVGSPGVPPRLVAPGLAWGVWVDLDAGRAEVDRIATMLTQLPVVSQSTLRRLRRAEAVLAALADRFVYFELLITDQPPALRLHFASRLAPAQATQDVAD